MPDFGKDKMISDMFRFFEAQRKAEENGEKDFECPLCGGHARWGRASNNHHLHTGCQDCGFVSME